MKRESNTNSKFMDYSIFSKNISNNYINAYNNTIQFNITQFYEGLDKDILMDINFETSSDFLFNDINEFCLNNNIINKINEIS